MNVNAHTFNVSLAVSVGLNQAILLQHLYYWHQINEKNNNNVIDGKVWTYNTAKGFSEIFPYLTAKQITYAFNKLEENGFIAVGNYNKAPFDQTKWYALEPKALNLFVKSNLQNVKSNRQNVKSNLQSVDPIPDNNTDSNTDNNTLDDVYGKIFFKIVDLYPANRVNDRQVGLKKFKKLDIEEAKLALKNLNRYLVASNGFVKSLYNYIDQKCFTEEWLQSEEKNKTKTNNKNPNHNFSGNYGIIN